MPLLLKPAVAEKADINIAILLVPLATAEGKPKKMSNGKVNNDPPPAIVFIKPAINPTKIKRG